MKEMSIDEMVHTYVQIRDAKAKAKKAFDNETSRMTAALLKLDALILGKLQADESESIKTASGTAYTKLRTSCTVKDRDAFYGFALQSGNLEAIDMKANPKICREILKGGIDIPGIKFSETSVIGIRRATK